MNPNFDLMFFVWAFGPFVIYLAGLKVLQWFRKRRLRRAPLTQKLGRTPGGTLLDQIDALSEEIVFQAVALTTLPIILYAGYITHLYASGSRSDPVRVGLLTVAGLAAGGYFLLSILRMVKSRRALRLGYIGELTVGQSLNRMMLAGWRVYPNFPAEGFEIDYVVVGVKGVFAVATMIRARPLTKNPRDEATVTYDGRMLHFPTGSNHEMIDQAKHQSKWLARWLSQAVGEPLSVRAVVALPGWLVKRTSPEGPPVVNPSQFDSLFQHIPPQPIPPEMMVRIVHQLDQRGIDIPKENLADEPR